MLHVNAGLGFGRIGQTEILVGHIRIPCHAEGVGHHEHGIGTTEFSLGHLCLHRSRVAHLFHGTDGFVGGSHSVVARIPYHIGRVVTLVVDILEAVNLVNQC